MIFILYITILLQINTLQFNVLKLGDLYNNTGKYSCIVYIEIKNTGCIGTFTSHNSLITSAHCVLPNKIHRIAGINIINKYQTVLIPKLYYSINKIPFNDIVYITFTNFTYTCFKYFTLSTKPYNPNLVLSYSLSYIYILSYTPLYICRWLVGKCVLTYAELVDKTHFSVKKYIDIEREKHAIFVTTNFRVIEGYSGSPLFYNYTVYGILSASIDHSKSLTKQYKYDQIIVAYDTSLLFL